jgi:hypothetical protein
MTWEQFLDRVGQHRRIHPAASREQLHRVEMLLGEIPVWLRQMLELFNGGKFFIRGLPFATLFGIADERDVGDWFVDRFTKHWRKCGGRDNDWAVGITSYGGVFIAKHDGSIKEWGTADEDWLHHWENLSEWLAWLVDEGYRTLK